LLLGMMKKTHGGMPNLSAGKDVSEIMWSDVM
jgi:hypothetical protein